MNRRVRLAPYLSGVLYRMRTEAGMFIFFNSLPIAPVPRPNGLPLTPIMPRREPV
jgi:hypothetical protein